MASHTMDDALINELVFKLGHLLPRERKHYSSLINNSEHIAYFVSHLQKYIERNFAKPLSENDLEDLIVMAADVRQILGSNVGAVCHEPPAGRAWIVFVNAIQGSSFLELEKINSHLRDEAKDHVMPEEVAAEIVKAYVSHNHVESSELSDLIAAVHASINNLDVHAASSSSDTGLTPPVPISKSVTPDYLISLEDGKKYKITGGADRSGAIPLTPKAKGGSVLKNTAYLVGEKGPELFLPSMAGSIIPNNKLSAMYNIPSSNWGISGTAENSGGVYNSTYNVKIELNGTNLSADDVYNKFEQKLAMLNAKQGRNKTIGGR